MAITNDSILEYFSNELPRSVDKITFMWYDYSLFIAVLGSSVLIGLYFGCFGNGSKSTKEYLLGGKTMAVIPIAISLVASHTSGITLLAVPADVYRFGGTYAIGAFSLISVIFLTNCIYLPVYHELQITSTYEYLALRFDEKTRKFASFLFALSVLIFLPVVIYMPALALSAATGFNIYYIIPILCGICIFYTTIGGMRALVWTDTLQFMLTLGSVGTVLILGLISVGGFGTVWEAASQSHRLDIDFSLDPTKRDTFWAVFTGMTTIFASTANMNQSCVQKFLSLSSLAKARRAVIYYCIGMIVVKAACVLIGLVMYTKYEGCDPLTTKEVLRTDQLLPFFVMDVARGVPGLSGLFIAGVFSAALSTLSAHLNCLAGTIYSDFIYPWTGPNISELRASLILKAIVVSTGLISTGLVYLVEHLGAIFQLATILKSLCDGPLLGIFTMGMLCRRFNSKGAFYGSLFGLMFMSWLVLTTKYYEAQGNVGYIGKPLSTENCNSHISNTTTLPTVDIPTPKLFYLFRVSFYYYPLIGAVITAFVGFVISCFTRPDDTPVPKILLSPVVHFLLPVEERKSSKEKEYYTINRALKIVTHDTETEKTNIY